MRIVGNPRLPDVLTPTEVATDSMLLTADEMPRAGRFVAVNAYLDTLGSGGGTVLARPVLYQNDQLVGVGDEIEFDPGAATDWHHFPVTGVDPDGLDLVAGPIHLGLHVGGTSNTLRVYGEPAGGFLITDAYADGAATPLVTSPGLDPALYGAWVGDPEEAELDDATLARRGFYTAQAKLSETGPVRRSQRRALCGWHGTWLDPEPQGASFAVVQNDGPLADLLGERVRVTSGDRSVVAYVHNALDLDSGDDISLTRRAYAALAPLATEELHVMVDTLA